ncbi:MAG: hypothetical protein V7K67_31285 [Nostoc sp.]
MFFDINHVFLLLLLCLRSHQSHQLRDRTIFTWFSVTLLQRHSVLEA